MDKPPHTQQTTLSPTTSENALGFKLKNLFGVGKKHKNKFDLVTVEPDYESTQSPETIPADLEDASLFPDTLLATDEGPDEGDVTALMPMSLIPKNDHEIKLGILHKIRKFSNLATEAKNNNDIATEITNVAHAIFSMNTLKDILIRTGDTAGVARFEISIASQQSYLDELQKRNALSAIPISDEERTVPIKPITLKSQETDRVPTRPTQPQPELVAQPVAIPKSTSRWNFLSKSLNYINYGVVNSTEKVLEKIKVPNVEKLKTRASESARKLKELGIKSLDSYNKLTPKEKLMIGAAVVGVGILTAGATAQATGAFYFAAKTREGYAENIKGKDNLTPKEKWLAAGIPAVKGLLWGALAGYTVAHAGEWLKYINNAIPDTIKTTVKDLVEKSWDEVKGHVNTPVQAVASVELGQMIDRHDLVDGVAKPKAELDLPQLDMVKSITLSLGDALEKVLTEYMDLPKTLTDQGKMSIIYNLFDSTDGKEALAEMGITDPNKIQPDQKINLQKLNELASKIKIGGETLLERATRLYHK